MVRKKPPSIYMEIFTIVLGGTTIGVGIWWLVISQIPIFGCIFLIVIGALYVLGGTAHYIQRTAKLAKTKPTMD